MNAQISTAQRYDAVIRWFSENMESAESELHFNDGYQLITAVILSAQCTDKRVNSVTPALFARFPTVKDMAAASEDEILAYIKSVSYPNSKARHLAGMARKVRDNFNCEIPSDIDQLMTLPGVGRKTANVVASILYSKPVIAVDTHVFRISRRLGLSDGNTPAKVEADLTANIPEELRAKSHHWLILQGRYVCTARKPSCGKCGLTPWCRTFQNGTHGTSGMGRSDK